MNEWRIADELERTLVMRLWKGMQVDSDQAKLAGLETLFIKGTGYLNCWYLAFQDQLSSNRKSRYSAEFSGECLDSDGVPIEAILVLDENQFPFELEITRMDGEPLQKVVAELEFRFES